MKATHPEKFDVVIVGAGPSGSSAAIRLSKAGRKVLLIEKAMFPRHKLCGEFVSPECLDHFDELGITESIRRHDPPTLYRTIFHSCKGRSFSIENKWLAKSNDHSIGVSRYTLDQILLKQAGRSGADVRQETALVDPIVENDRISGLILRSIGSESYEIRADIAIDATGRGRHLARYFDRSAKNMRAKEVAFKTHIRGARIESGNCELFGFQGGYGGSSAVESGLYDLCFVVDSRKVRAIGNDPMEIFWQTYLTNPRASDVFREIEVVSDWLTVPLARYGSSEVVPFPGVLAIGDAAAFIDPFTGSGIALALESSRLAAAVILNSTNAEDIATTYRRAHEASFNWRLRACGVIRYLSRSQPLSELLVGGLGSSEYVRRSIARLTRSSTMMTSTIKGN